MANLSEILNDPNYINANEETKAAIFTKYAPLDENYTKANAATQAAIRSKFGVEGRPGMGPQSGFDTALYSGYQNIKGDIAGLLGRSGLMSLERAKEIQELTEDKRRKAFKPTEEGWAGAPLTKFGELLGQSLPYMVAPVVAGGAATLAGAPGIAAAGLAALASGTQFTGSNISRQQETGLELENTSLGAAALAAVPQALLETLSFRMIPGVQRIFGAAGKQLTPEQAAQVVKQGMFKTAGEMVKTGVKVGSAEGATEVGQQFFERLQAGLNIADKDARDEYLESFVSGAILGAGLSLPGAGMRRMQAEQIVGSNQPQTFIDPNTGVTMTASPVELADPNLELAGTEDVDGRPVYIYAPRQEEDAIEVEQVAPETIPSNEALDTDAMVAELEGRSVQGALPIEDTTGLPPPAPVIADVAPEPVIEPAVEPAVEPVIEPVAPPPVVEAVDPNIEAQLAAEPFDADLAIPLDAEGRPIPPEPKVQKVRQPRAPVAPRVYFGTDADGNLNVPIDEGGVPFKTRKEAQSAKSLQPNMTVIPRKDGFVLAEKTDKQLAADEAKAQRLRTGPQGILSAHEFIASLGGLNKKEASEIDKDAAKSNVRVGNKYLYSNKGMSIAEATEKLQEAGYIDSDSSNAGYQVIADSLVDPVYSVYDADAIAERQMEQRAQEEAAEFARKEQEAQMEVADLSAEAVEQQNIEAADLRNFRQQMLDAGYTEQDLNVIGFTKASPELQAEVVALNQMAREMGLDPIEQIEVLDRDLADGNITKQEYYAKSKNILAKAIEEKAEQRGRRDVGEADVQESAAREVQEVKSDKISEARSGDTNQDRSALLSKTFGKENVLYQSGDLALVLGNNMFNDPVYLPVKGTTYLKADLTKDKKPDLLTTPEFERLIAEKERIESEAQAKHKANPFIKFKDGVAVSESISSLSPELADVFAGWKKMLRLNGNIYLTTAGDALANADKFTGPHRRIGVSVKKFAREKLSGVTQKMGEDRYIIIDENVSPEQMLEVLAHEMGHAHQQEAFYGAPKDVRDKVQRAYEEWLKKQKGATSQELINALRPFRTARATKLDTPSFQAKSVLKDYDSYWTSFSEWYADNTARWATTSDKPLSVVDKFFAKVAQTLRNFFDAIKTGGFLPNETFKEYMDAITDKEAVAANPIAPDDAKGQLPLFAKQAAQPTLPGGTPAPKSLPLKPKPAATWQSLEPMTWKDTRAIQLFDKHRNLDLVQKEISKIAGEITGDLNAYRAETLAHGRAERQVKDFLTGEFRPIIKEMKDGNVTDEALTEYLVMRHAKEANDLIAKRNPNDPNKQDKGSGVSYKQRDDYFKALDPAKKKVFESIAKKVDGVLKKTRDLLEEGGVITKEQRDAWESLFQYYVPLRREESDYSLPSSSYRRVGDYAKSRTGSSKDVIDVLSNIASNREIAINRIEKERVNRAVYGLSVMNPNPEYWMAVSPDAIKNKDVLISELEDKFDLSKQDAEAFVKNIMAEPTKERFNKETGVVDRSIDTTAKYADYVLPVKVDGKDRFVFFNPKNDRAMQMVQSLRGLDVPQLGAVMQTIAPITRFFSAINTQYNLIFGAWNFARDVQGARMNLSTTPIADEKNAVLSGTFSAIPDIYTAVREQNADQPFSDTSDGSWDDFTRHGGKVGYKDQFAKLNQSTNIVNKELARLDRGFTMRRAYALANWISNVNDVLENSTRLSAYRVAFNKFKKEAEARNPGGQITQKQIEDMKSRAAEIAKNITVNFNRKGTWGVTAGSLYAFFNASAQGTKRMYETLTGPKGKTIMAAGIGIGIAQAIALAFFGFDEDEPTEFMKQKNLIIPTGDGKYVMWPMPFGFNVFPNLGRIFFETASKTSKGQDITPQLVNTVEMLANAFNPLGGGGLLQMVTPTVADPVAALIENRDAFGRPISRESRSTSPVPGYKLSRDPSPSISQFLAEFINTITFGDKDKKGLLSPTADQIDYLGKQLGGGVYREASGILTYVSDKIQDKETPDYKIPIAGKIVGDLNSPPAISQRFYSNVIKMAEHEASIKGRVERRESVADYMRKNPEAAMWRRANTLENEISKLNRRRRELVGQQAPVERIKQIDDQKTRMMKQFNDQVRRYDK